MSWLFCSSGAATVKAGADVSSTIKQDHTELDNFSNQAEARIESETRRTWKDDFANLASGLMFTLNDVCSSIIANRMINFDLDAYPTMEMAQTMLDLNDDIVQRGMKYLKDFKSQTLKSVD